MFVTFCTGCLWGFEIDFLIPVSDSLSSSVLPQFITRVKTVAQIAEELEAGTTPGIIRNIRKNQPALVCSVLQRGCCCFYFIAEYNGEHSPRDPLVSFPNMVWEGNSALPCILKPCVDAGSEAYAFDSNFWCILIYEKFQGYMTWQRVTGWERLCHDIQSRCLRIL